MGASIITILQAFYYLFPCWHCDATKVTNTNHTTGFGHLLNYRPRKSEPFIDLEDEGEDGSLGQEAADLAAAH